MPSNSLDNTIDLPFPKVVLASGNLKKIQEFETLFLNSNQIIPQPELGIESVEETGLTFIENALLKARHAAQESGLPALADDSGLVVEALDGAPGIFSGRYAGSNATDLDNCQKLLSALESALNRAAFFHATIVFVEHAMDPDPVIAQGRWHGEILKSPRGDGGFGYDPLFFIADVQLSAAELSAQEKNHRSHRGQALRTLTHQLNMRFQQ